MLEQVDGTSSLSKEEYAQAIAPLDARLQELQRACRDAGIPVMVVVEGWDAAGKGTLINKLISPLDPRGYNVHTVTRPSEDELLRPFFWRFWAKTPARGRIAMFDRGWYKEALLRIEAGDSTITEHLADTVAFEQQLADGGTCIVKLFLHIEKKVQKHRLEKLEADPATSWRVTEEDWRRFRRHKKTLAAFNAILTTTRQERAPWTVIPGKDKRYAEVQAKQVLVQALEAALTRKAAPASTETSPALPAVSSVLDSIDLAKSLSHDDYSKELKELQGRMRAVEHRIYRMRIPVVIGYEGWDAAGKGGNIKRLTDSLDPRGYEVVPIAAPTEEERAHHYLWRFWRRLPKAGHIAIFDRTWYGRVLVERVEKFCSTLEWQRAFREINEFERDLAEAGTVVLKFWLHVDQETQLARFTERQNNPLKQFKITAEDWRNREKWDLYRVAVDDMLARTSTDDAPWIVVEANDKLHARIKVLETVASAVERALERREHRAKRHRKG